LSNKNKIQPVILSGGFGTRLWPLSRENFPKQYIKLDSTSSLSFLQKTQQRLRGLENIEKPIIICNEQHRFIVAEQMREIQIKPKSIILEPFARNTAPAIAIASLIALEENKKSTLLILSSDHEIKDDKKFKEILNLAIEESMEHKLITLGVKPTRPETGYGYIEINKNINEIANKSIPINKFVEKPNLETAKDFLKKGRYLWNSGIFFFDAKTIIDELNKYQPELLNFCKLSLINSSKDFDFQRLNKENFSKCANLSIDEAVMEKTKKAYVIPFEAGWSDAGSWQAIWDIEKKDKEGNTIIGDIQVSKVKNSYLNSQSKLLVGIGLDNMVVIQTDDATLVANIKKSQEIKNIVNKLNLEGRNETKIHKKVFRPWGYYKLIETGLNWQVKEICVYPESSLSLQKHIYRSEHWIVLKGSAEVQINTQKIILNENQSTYIPMGVKHRLSNNKKDSLTIIEVQTGAYLGEDDIIRYNDNYGRSN